jgi:hypothetical protein
VLEFADAFNSGRSARGPRCIKKNFDSSGTDADRRSCLWLLKQSRAAQEKRTVKKLQMTMIGAIALLPHEHTHRHIDAGQT